MRFPFIALSLLVARLAVAIPAEDAKAVEALQEAGAAQAAGEAVGAIHAAHDAEAAEAEGEVEEIFLDDGVQAPAGAEGEAAVDPYDDTATKHPDEKSEAYRAKSSKHGWDRPRAPPATTVTVHETLTLSAKDAAPTKDVFDDHHGCNHNRHHFQHHGHKFKPPEASSTVTVTAVGVAPEETPEPIPNAAGVVTVTSYTMIPSISSQASLPFATTITEKVIYKKRRGRHAGELLVVVFKQHVKMPTNSDNFIIVLPPWYERREDRGFAFSWDGWTQRLGFWVRQQDKKFASHILKRARRHARARAAAIARQKGGGHRSIRTKYKSHGRHDEAIPRRPYRPRPRPAPRKPYRKPYRKPIQERRY